MMISYVYALWNDYHNQLNYHGCLLLTSHLLYFAEWLEKLHLNCLLPGNKDEYKDLICMGYFGPNRTSVFSESCHLGLLHNINGILGCHELRYILDGACAIGSPASAHEKGQYSIDKI